MNSATWTKQARDTFWQKVDQSAGPDGCWPWLLSKRSTGYGQVNMGKSHGPSLAAHRVAYELANGPIPSLNGVDHRGTVIMHTCDNSVCCNPKHLRAGTQSENLADMHRKGRLVATPRMTKEQVKMIDAYPQLVEDRARLVKALKSALNDLDAFLETGDGNLHSVAGDLSAALRSLEPK